MARFNPVTDIEEGEIIEPPKRPTQHLRADLAWRKGDRQLSPAKEAKLRAEPYPRSPSHTRTRPRSPGPAPIPKYRPPGAAPENAQEFRFQLDNFIFEWRQRQTQKEITMSADGYARAVQRLQNFPIRRRVGKGTLEDPEVR